MIKSEPRSEGRLSEKDKMLQEKSKTRTIRLVIVLVLGLSLTSIGTTSAHAAPSCSPAGSTGLTTLMVAHSHQTIKGMTINAAGCDVGIYVPPGSKHVVIRDNDVSGAGIHGIFVQDSSHITIRDNNVHDNSAGVPAVSCDFVKEGPCINEGKAIQLVGTSDSTIARNSVSNDQFGGIAITDDGQVDPGALKPGSPNNADHNIVIGNTLTKVAHDCSIVVAVYNDKAVAEDNFVFDNNIQGSLPPFGANPFVGQIVVATDGPGATIRDTFVFHNVINGSTLPGIVVHSNAPGDSISRTVIIGNRLGNNGYYPPFFSTLNTPVASDGTTGISIVAEAAPDMTNPPTISGTVLINNMVSPDQIGVWLCNTTGTRIINTPNGDSSVTSPLVKCASGGS